MHRAEELYLDGQGLVVILLGFDVIQFVSIKIRHQLEGLNGDKAQPASHLLGRLQRLFVCLFRQSQVAEQSVYHR